MILTNAEAKGHQPARESGQGQQSTRYNGSMTPMVDPYRKTGSDQSSSSGKREKGK